MYLYFVEGRLLHFPFKNKEQILLPKTNVPRTVHPFTVHIPKTGLQKATCYNHLLEHNKNQE